MMTPVPRRCVFIRWLLGDFLTAAAAATAASADFVTDATAAFAAAAANAADADTNTARPLQFVCESC